MRLYLKRRICKLLYLIAILWIFVHFYQYFCYEHFLNTFQWPPYLEDMQIEVAQQFAGHEPNAPVFNDWNNHKALIRPQFPSNWQCSEKHILVIVKTAPDRVDRRAAIRETYASIKTKAGFRLDYVFVMGRMPGWEQALAGEAQKWGDLLVGDYQDNYYNNTQKFLSSIQLARHFCGPSRAVPFLFLLDDDYVMLPWELVKEVRRHRSTKSLYMGFCYFSATPYREPGCKFDISYEEYPYDYYPPFCAAGSVLLSQKTVEQFYVAIQYAKLLRIDDIYTGILAHLLKIPAIHNVNFWLWSSFQQLSSNVLERFFSKSPRKLGWRGIISAHGYGPDALRTLFAQLNATRNFK